MAKREVRSYSETERLGAMTLAVVTSAQEAATLTNIPKRTIDSWLARHGGLAQVRPFLESAVLNSRLAVEQVLNIEMMRRMKDLPDGELAATYRDVATAVFKVAAVAGDVPVAAQQQSQHIIVNLYEGDGDGGKGGPVIEGESRPASAPGDDEPQL